MARTGKVLGVESGGPDALWSRLAIEKKLDKTGFRTTEAYIPDYELERVRDFFDFYTCPAIPNHVTSVVYPDYTNAAHIWNANENSSYKWYIEAMLMDKNSTFDEIAADLGDDVRPQLILAYKKLFFDLRGNTGALGWMHKHIWGPGYNSHDNVFYCNYIYKLVSHFGGKEMFKQVMSPGALPPKTNEWLINHVMSQRTKMVLNTSGSYAKLSTEASTQIGENIVERWNTVQDKVNEASGVHDEGAIKQVARAVTDSMVMLNALHGGGKKERVDVVMYKEEDLIL